MNSRGYKRGRCFRLGRLQEAKEINDKLLSQMGSLDDLQLDISLAITSGDWEHIATIIERERPRQESLTPEILMTLAQLAGRQGLTPDRALQFAKLAAQKAPNDPRILMAAHWLHFRLGRDDEANPDWLKRAYDLSSADQGPIVVYEPTRCYH